MSNPGPGDSNIYASSITMTYNSLEGKNTVPFPWASPIPGNYNHHPLSLSFSLFLLIWPVQPLSSHKVCVPARKGPASWELPLLFEEFACPGVGVQDNSIQGRFLSPRNSHSQIGAA